MKEYNLMQFVSQNAKDMLNLTEYTVEEFVNWALTHNMFGIGDSQAKTFLLQKGVEKRQRLERLKDKTNRKV